MSMQTYIVLYRDQTLLPLDAPLGFRCQADDPDHAEEQCRRRSVDAQASAHLMIYEDA